MKVVGLNARLGGWPATVRFFGMRKFKCTSRLVASLSALIWAGYIALYFRSMDAGSSPHTTLLITMIFAGPIAAAVLVGLPWRRHLALLAVILLVATVAAETIATVEEALFAAEHHTLPATGEVVFKDRWWPNGNSFIYYDPATGELGGGD